MNYHFTREDLRDFDRNIRREWVMTNGLGGYAGSSVLGAHNRTHQGYLIASLHPPVERYLVFSRTCESVTDPEGHLLFDLTTSQHRGGKRSSGSDCLTAFTYDGGVRYEYQCGDISLSKQIVLVRGCSRTYVSYEITNRGERCLLRIVPLMNFREHSASSTVDTLRFSVNCEAFPEGSSTVGFSLIPQEAPDTVIRLHCSEGRLAARTDTFDPDNELQTEVDNETDGLDTHFCPYDLWIEVPAGSSKHISLLCGTDLVAGEPVAADSGAEAYRDLLAYKSELLQKLPSQDTFSCQLAMAADQFLTYRESTGCCTVLAGLPWFTDWGRDTMISFTGLTLCTGRFREAREILGSFAVYEKDGLIPNMFPDDGLAPFYNTADASLWYFYAVHKYLSYDSSEEALAFIHEKIYPVLVKILQAYCRGTSFSIYMDTDGLIHAGSGLDQVTWMDVRVGDWVATPRHGKPVEINALWYNALCIMENLEHRFRLSGLPYEETLLTEPVTRKPVTCGCLAPIVREAFCSRFLNPQTGCLYDVVPDVSEIQSGVPADDTIRPNQIYAVSLPYPLLTPAQEAAVVDVVFQKLYVGCGLRSLDPEHRDYHPHYIGSLDKRDHAYHQGTAWGFLLGAFLTAFMKVHDHSEEAAAQALDLLAPIRAHLLDNGIGTICEIFDGDAPHTGRGCYGQAWSVGEILRAYTEDIRPCL